MQETPDYHKKEEKGSFQDGSCAPDVHETKR